jgi:hypothetical protein
MCVIHRRRHELAVVPAKAGTHSHQCSSLSDAVATTFFNNSTLWLMVWTAPYGISVPE